MRPSPRRFPAPTLAGLRPLLLCGVLLTNLPWAQAEAPSPPPPALLLAETASSQLDPAPYWVSEKLDGVRAFWDGRVLRFRSGNPVPAPAWFTAALPSQPLDGELWIARESFDQVSGIVRSNPPNDRDWKQVRYMVFELPNAPGSFTERIARMRTLVERAQAPWLQMVPQFRVPNSAALKQQLDKIVKAGGEGLMLHRADAPYQTGRQDVLLKLKPWQDAEATVIGYTPGKGKYAGLTGALNMQMPDGKIFRIGSGLSDALRRNPPPIGAQITYRYQSLTPSGLPRFARYLRVREKE
ncbi:putative ATP-dependent DNA ligase [Thiomonas arsenitoxydans]|uniref:ATP-dependent DNA ligase n=1 Tax=Thiomonas arsenitoxydans (strain DSM 22701 / CIP 110005 / 3As) TaxID=426114 RepID=D6CV64_THIA3|nr:DNA ligase [Thiomonas arsenitoxydans]CQR45374.1 putative ATP-dependent DNA ligase [Thiomonas sp. CB3]CAZ89183.1 putative ATP-dependent DNA ligase [Thiomonas arsenitoxydans]CQR34561.1 putative ATP-dependent DNA ligase [Thiomonas arsenitoxydans]CQR34928.1 putative ATP-dependent DNA ligase [Thiomonas arsenitoxydans]CQR37164.1 putative ATP-dependent DNA ligase [Thiomonas arsenitoxydans]